MLLVLLSSAQVCVCVYIYSSIGYTTAVPTFPGPSRPFTKHGGGGKMQLKIYEVSLLEEFAEFRGFGSGRRRVV